MKNDEFNSQPSEYREGTNEVAPLGGEFNEWRSKLTSQSSLAVREAARKAQKKRRKKITSLIAATCASVGIGSLSVYSTVTAENSGYVYEFECHNSAVVDSKDDSTIAVITGGVPHTTGSVWITETLDAEQDFTIEFDYMVTGSISGPEGSLMGGDGMSVSFIEPKDFDLSKEHDGGELGYIGQFGVEYDMFQNPTGEIRGTKDFGADHIAIIDEGMNHLSGTEFLFINGLYWYHTKIEYKLLDDNSAQLKAYIGDKLCADTVIGSIGSELLVGISAGNGDASGWCLISELKVNGTLVELIDRDQSIESDVLEKLEKTNALPISLGGKNKNNSERQTTSEIDPDAEPWDKDNISYDYNEDNVFPETEENEPENEPEDNNVKYVCSACLGTGKCTECHGTGSVECGNKSDSCSQCHGTGVASCGNCNASGECPECQGVGAGDSDITGEIKQCDDCNGTGIICGGSLLADDPDGCGGYVIVNCKACNNTGYEKGKPCSWCNGTLRHLCPSFEVHRVCDKCGGKGVYIE